MLLANKTYASIVDTISTDSEDITILSLYFQHFSSLIDRIDLTVRTARKSRISTLWMTQLTAPSKGCGLLLSCPSWRELRMQMTWTLRYQTEYLFRRACEYAMSQGVEADAEKAVHCTDYRFAKLWYLCQICRFHSIWILVNDDLKILHYLTSLCESAGFIGQSTTKSRLRVRGLDAVPGFDLVRHLRSVVSDIISPTFHHSPLQSRRKRPEGLIRSLFCFEVWTLIWIAITSKFSNVFWTVFGFRFWHVLTHFDHHKQPLKRSIADVSSPLSFLKTQRLPTNRRSLYLES